MPHLFDIRELAWPILGRGSVDPTDCPRQSSRNDASPFLQSACGHRIIFSRIRAAGKKRHVPLRRSGNCARRVFTVHVSPMRLTRLGEGADVGEKGRVFPHLRREQPPASIA